MRCRLFGGWLDGGFVGHGSEMVGSRNRWIEAVGSEMAKALRFEEATY